MNNPTANTMTINLNVTGNSHIQFTKIGEDIKVEKITDTEDGNYKKETIGMVMNRTIGDDFEKFEAFCKSYVKNLDKFYRNYKGITLIEIDDNGIVTLDFEKGNTYSVMYDARFGEITDILLNSEASLMNEYRNDLGEIVAIIKGIDSLQEIIEEELGQF